MGGSFSGGKTEYVFMLRIKNLVKGYSKGDPVLKGLDLDVRAKAWWR